MHKIFNSLIVISNSEAKHAFQYLVYLSLELGPTNGVKCRHPSTVIAVARKFGILLVPN